MAKPIVQDTKPQAPAPHGLRALIEKPAPEHEITPLLAAVNEAKNLATNIYASVGALEGLMPVEGQVRTGALYSLMSIKRDLEGIDGAVSALIERHKFEIGRHCVDRDEPIDSIGDPNLSISVKPDIRFGVDPECWDKLPKDLLQKRLLSSVCEKGFAAGDKKIVDLCNAGIITQTPYLNVSIRRKPGK